MRSVIKTKQINIRLSDKDYKQFQELTKANKTTMSAYLVSCIREKKIPDESRKELRELRNQLLKIGTNLNQLTRLANTQGIIIGDLDQTLKEVTDIVGKINELI